MSSLVMGRVVKAADGSVGIDPIRPAEPGHVLRVAALVTAARQYKTVLAQKPDNDRLIDIATENLHQAALDI